MKRSVWGVAAAAALGAVSVNSSMKVSGFSQKGIQCKPIGAQPFQGLAAPVAGVGMISEGSADQYLIPYLTFDKASRFSGAYQAMLWNGGRWKSLKVGTFHATNGVLQFVNLRGRWFGFSNSAQAVGGAQIPTLYVGDRSGVFERPQAIETFSNWGEFDSAARNLDEDRIGITGRDRFGGGFTNVFAQKIGGAPWISEPILINGKATPQGFSTLIGYDRGNTPWIAYESLPGRAGNEAGILTRTAQGWKLIPVSTHDPVNLVGAYLPPGHEHGGERIALAWVEKGAASFEIKAAILELDTQRLVGQSVIATTGLGRAGAAPPLPAITVAHDGRRATVALMNAETHQGWTGKLHGGAFETLKEYAAPSGQGVVGFPQAFYSSCDDTPRLMVGLAAVASRRKPLELGSGFRLEKLTE